MNTTPFADFPSKILLFGEYSLMFGSMALSMPSGRFSGRLRFAESPSQRESSAASNKALKEFVQALIKRIESNKLTVELDTDRLLQDISKGLFFESNIPQGYGLGSSGALVAAIFTAYTAEGKGRGEAFPEETIESLKKIFADMESFFHGKSSGLDPLISFLDHPVLVDSREKVRTVRIPESKPDGKAALFLLDSGASGETQPLVNLFVKHCRDEDYLRLINEELTPLNNRCIRAFLEADVTNLTTGMEALSYFTFEHLSPMVPDSVNFIWKKGLRSNDFFLKLCGSGGGGMLLGFAPDMGKARTQLQDFETEVIHRF